MTNAWAQPPVVVRSFTSLPFRSIARCGGVQSKRDQTGLFRDRIQSLKKSGCTAMSAPEMNEYFRFVTVTDILGESERSEGSGRQYDRRSLKHAGMFASKLLRAQPHVDGLRSRVAILRVQSAHSSVVLYRRSWPHARRAHAASPATLDKLSHPVHCNIRMLGGTWSAVGDGCFHCCS